MTDPFDQLPAALQKHYQAMQDDLYDGLLEEVVEGTQRALDWGQSPAEILAHGLQAGLDLVGKDFGDGILYVPELLRAANAMKAAMGLLRPLLIAGGTSRIGVAVIGTVRGDIHDIGKNLVAMMWEGAGFDVVNLGINVDAREFLAAVRGRQANILGMSALVTTAMPSMRKVMDELRAEGLRSQVGVLVGGAPLNAAFAHEIGADAYGRDAVEAVQIALGAGQPAPSGGFVMDLLSEFLSRYPVVIGDGAMGTMLHAAGLTSGNSPEEWNVSHPDALRGIYQAYLDAGSQIIETNTFGGNRFRLKRHDLQDRVAELNRAGVALAREVVAAFEARTGRAVLVAGSMGPTGEIFVPLGNLDPAEAQAAFAEQAAALDDGGADFVIIETMSALDEVEAAVAGVHDACDLPIAVTMTFDTHFRTMMGVKPVQALRRLYELGIRVIGANCGNGPGEIERVIGEMAAIKPDDAFLIAQANAGLPKMLDDQTHYDGTPEVMAAYAERMQEMGIRYIGACCGSTPAHIKAMRAALH